MSVGADSTIAPIFAGGLAIVAASGKADYAASAAALAVAVGLILVLAGVFRLGFIADLLSIPVTTGFLAGIAVHILASQAPALLGVDGPTGPMIQRLLALAANAGAGNPWTLAIGIGVFAIIFIAERLDPRIPGALIALSLATGLTAALHLETRGVSTLGAIAGAAPAFSIPFISFETFRDVAPLALIVSVVVMVQTAATTRQLRLRSRGGPQRNRDFIGVGASNLVGKLAGPLARGRETAAHRRRRRNRRGLAAGCAGLRRARARALSSWRRLAETCALCRARGGSVVHRAAHRAARRDGGRLAAQQGGVRADRRHHAGDRRAPDRAGRRPRDHPFAGSRRLDDDAGEHGRIRAHCRHLDLVAEERDGARRDASRRQRDRAAGAAVVPQRLSIPAGASGRAEGGRSGSS